MEIKTLDDVDVRGKTVIVRVDINSPIDPKTKEILDDTRIRECSPTLRELTSKGAKVVLLAHQGRPGSEDFTTLKKHAEKLSGVLRQRVKHIDDIFGRAALEAIAGLKSGEVLVLENVRSYPQENKDRPPEEQAKTELVQKLSKVADLYVNDAFAAAHRSQPSLVGFQMVLPTYAGRLMERELNALSRALSPQHPCVYVLGGVKVDDSLKIIENAFSNGIADAVLTGGLVGLTFLAVSGVDLGEQNSELLKKRGATEEFDRAKRLLDVRGEKIKVPLDLVVDAQGEPKELGIKELPTELLVCDIGSRTIEEYSKIIAGAKTVVANGPLGVFERAGFERGTFEVLKAIGSSRAFTIVGGGHMVAAAQASGVAGQIKHLSTGGGACISFLAGETLPVVEVLTKKPATR